jgi:hypothetical protein
VYLKFRYIFAGDTSWAGKPQRNPVVDILAAFRVAQPHMSGASRRRQAAGEDAKRLTGARPAYANDRDRRLPRRGCRGEDGVGGDGRC